MSAAQPSADAGPVRETARITSLDLIRGVAVLGILLMNAVSFKLDDAAYFNLSADGSNNWLDWAVGVFGEIFVDQKFMGLFSLLFGASMILFIDRAAARGARAVLLNMWRNALLLLIGILHLAVWDGDVLTVYAVSSVFLLALRRLPNWWLIAIGAALFALSAALGLVSQYIADSTAAWLADMVKTSDIFVADPRHMVADFKDKLLAGLWTPGEIDDQSGLALVVLSGFFLRALGAILIGAGLYRIGFMSGAMSASAYRKTALVGLAIGLPLAALGVIATALNGYSREVAFIGQIPNTLGTMPAALGYMSLIILWNSGADAWLKRRLRAVGRMALTNYLTQTLFGVLILTILLGDNDSVGRAALLLFVFAVWAAQLWWSQAWLGRFLFGPAEWLWRVATYRRGQPLRRIS